MTTASATASAFGHGKVILLGEHAVVYGQPALAAGIDRGVEATASAGTGRLTVPAWDIDTHRDQTPVGRAFAALLARLEVSDADVVVDARLPARAGLGSSAALAVAVARATAHLRGRDPQLALAAASDAETIFHGTASGIDLAAASTGQVGRFKKPQEWRPVTMRQPITLSIGLSGRQHDTRAQVDAVRRLRERTPAVGSIIETMGALVDPGEAALGRGDIDELGRLFDIAHGLLAALRVSSPELETLVHLARGAGAVGAKLTGAGGGGAVLALGAGHEQDILRRWREAGFEGFVTTIGGDAKAVA